MPESAGGETPGVEPGPVLETWGEADGELRRFEVDALGTRNVFLLGGAGDAAVRAAAQEGFALIEQLEDRLSKFRPESDVALVNRLAAAGPVAVGEGVFLLLERARAAWEASGGAFDPTVGPLLEAWGLVDRVGRVPTDEELEAVLARCGMPLVRLDGEARTVALERPGVQLDLGGIGKGWIADRIAAAMQARGLARGVVSCGRSTVVTWGEPPGGGRWRFGIVDPRDPSRTLATVSAPAGAMSSSGAYERFVRVRGVEYGHVIDPRTGRPARSDVLGATVWTRTALLGDVLSTVLYLLGPPALAPDGCAAGLAGSWEDGAVGALLVERAPERWGGIRLERLVTGGARLDVEAAEG